MLKHSDARVHSGCKHAVTRRRRRKCQDVRLVLAELGQQCPKAAVPESQVAGALAADERTIGQHHDCPHAAVSACNIAHMKLETQLFLHFRT